MFTFDKVSLGTSIQDFGRQDGASIGVTTSGAADQFSFRLANYFCGNPLHLPAIETTFGRVSLSFNQTCQFVITGADCNATLNGTIISTETLMTAKTGDILELQHPKEQVHSYIAFVGGFTCKHWLSSASQANSDIHLNMTEASLSAGQAFTVNHVESNIEANRIAVIPQHFHQDSQLSLRFIPTELWHQLTKVQQQHFFQQAFTIDNMSNRMGYRFNGEAIDCSPPQQLSKPVVYGAIQLLPSGLPIVLMKEHQTMGGYPVIGHVYQVDLYRLAQKRPGEKVLFTEGNLAQAQAQKIAFDSLFE